MKKRLLSTLLALCLCFPAGVPVRAADLSGKGTKDDPYRIYNQEDLKAVNDHLSAYFSLQSDITVTEGEWTAIGYDPDAGSWEAFTGTFDGNDHTISGLFIEDKGQTRVYKGLFARNRGTIKNLRVEVNFYVNGHNTPAGTTNYTGGLAAYSEGFILNCHAAAYGAGGRLYDDTEGGNCGGLVGYNSGIIWGSTADVDVSAYMYVGGLAGYNTGSILSCSSSGSVYASYIGGGLVGENQDGGFISSCWSDGNVRSPSIAGGLAGHLGVHSDMPAPRLLNCYARGDVSATSTVDPPPVAGGLVGSASIYSSGSRSVIPVIENCYSTGTVTVYRNGKAGGLLGVDGGASIISSYYGARPSEDENTTITEGGTLVSGDGMKQQGTYDGWDFGGVWAIDPAANEGYPYLRKESGPPEFTPVTGVKLNSSDITINFGSSLSSTLKATVEPETASNQNVFWTSSEPAVATVSGAGRVTAQGAGEAIITATTVDGGFTAECKVTVVIRATGVTLDKSTLSLTTGDSETLTATVAPENATDKTVTWTSSEPTVASVSNGTVTALKAGTATISARVVGSAVFHYAYCEVTVTEPIVSVTGVTLNKSSLGLTVGGSETLTASVKPENATNQNVTWTSSDGTVATVSDEGEVTALKAGDATITVTTEDGGKTAECTVKVTDPAPAVVPVESVSLNKTELGLAVGGSETLTATVAPENATNQNVTWTSSDGTVATVSDEGEVTALKAGDATITVTTEDGGKTAECTVKVTDPAPAVVPVESVSLNKTELGLAVGGSETLTATVSPSNATNQNVSWKSSDDSVATVADGKVTAVKVGTATITVTTEDGNKTAECIVTVTESPKAAITGVTLNETELSLTVGESKTLVATVEPADAVDKSLTWTSSNPAVATVSNGMVTATGAGTAVITVTTKNGKTATCTVIVMASTSTTVSVTGVTLDKSTLSLTAGASETLTATVSPSNATNKSVTWTSSDSAVATVSNGTVTALKAGTATITVTTEDGNKTATCTVTVSDPTPSAVPVTGVTLNKTTLSLTVNSSETLTATVSPSNATNKSVTWTTSDSTVATVDGGKVMAVKAGTATITVTTEDGNKTAACAVTVTEPATGDPSITYTITFNANGGSVSPASADTDTDGKLTSLPTPARNGYIFDGWFTSASGGTEVTTATVFSSNATIYAHWTDDWYDPINYRIYVYSDPSRGGSVYGGGTYRRGEYATVRAYPASGYRFLRWTEDGWYVSSSADYSFTVTESRVLTAEFELIASSVSSSSSATASNTTNTGTTASTPSPSNNPALRNPYIINTVDSMPRMPSDIGISSTPSTSSSPFSDVPSSSTFSSAITWAQSSGIMGGYADGTFRPYAGTNRQQMWMALARLSGANPANMAEARTWAINTGISDGSNAEGTMNRQQMATMVYRFAKLQGIATSGSADLSAYFDSGDVAPYAREAMAWAVGNGFITGVTDGTLKADSTAVRAHFATFLYRFNSL